MAIVATIAVSVGPQEGHAGECGKIRSQITIGPTTENISMFANHPSPQRCSRDSPSIIAVANRSNGIKTPPLKEINRARQMRVRCTSLLLVTRRISSLYELLSGTLNHTVALKIR